MQSCTMTLEAFLSALTKAVATQFAEREEMAKEAM